MRADPDDLETWQALLASPGWIRLGDLLEAEIQYRKERGIRSAADEPDDPVALGKLRQVLAWEQGVRFVLELPRQHLLRARRDDEPRLTTMLTRGGPRDAAR